MKNRIIISDMLLPSDKEQAMMELIFNNGGIYGMEMRSGDFINSNDTEGIRHYQALLRKAKVNIVSVHAPFIRQDISSGNEYERKRSIRDIEKAVLIGGEMNADYTVLHCSGMGDFIESDAMDNVKRSLDEIRITADNNNIKLLVENTIPGMLVYSPEHIERILDMGYALCFDWGHAMISGIEPEAFYRGYSKHIELIHFHVNNGADDMHMFDREVFERVLEITDDNVIVEIETDRKYFDYADIAQGGLTQ